MRYDMMREEDNCTNQMLRWLVNVIVILSGLLWVLLEQYISHQECKIVNKTNW